MVEKGEGREQLELFKAGLQDYLVTTRAFLEKVGHPGFPGEDFLGEFQGLLARKGKIMARLKGAFTPDLKEIIHQEWELQQALGEAVHLEAGVRDLVVEKVKLEQGEIEKLGRELKVLRGYRPRYYREGAGYVDTRK